MKKHVYLQYTMNTMIFLLLAGSISYSIILSLYLPVSFLQAIGISFLIYLVLSLLLRTRNSFLLSFPVLILALWIYTWSLPKKWWADVFLWLEWVISYIQGLVPLKSHYVMPTVWLIVFLISLSFFILTIKMRKLLLAFCMAVALLGIQWFLGHEQIISCIWLFALSMIMHLSSRHYYSILQSKISIAPDYGLWLFWTLPLALTVIFTAFLFTPQDASKFKWQFLEDKINDIRNQWSERFEFTQPRTPFRLAQTGFSPSSDELGGPIQISDDIILEVQSSRSLYLRGTILNEYTGSNWIDSVDDKRYRFSDFYWKRIRNTSYDWDESIWDELDSSQINRFFPSVNATIHHVGIESSVLFNVLRCVDISPIGNNQYIPYYNERSETFTSRTIGKEEGYTLSMRIPDIDDPEFQKFIIQYVSASDMEQFCRLSNSTDEKINEKHQFILQHYTNIPYTVPQRVHQLALSITKDASSPFEKAKLLENYLKNEFKYALDPPYTPKGRDFVDYFLFELKEGYCTYFASAMAVMGRTIGLPTRYIEGFSMPQTTSKQNLYEVRKEHGHAWVEVYFPKVGWLPFDPTPVREISEHRAERNNLNLDFSYEEEYMDEEMPPDIITHGLDITLPNGTKSNNSRWISKLAQIIWVLIPLGFLVLITVSVMLWYRLRWHPIKKYPLNAQLRLYYKEILWLLEQYQFPIQPGETPYRYGKRVDTWLVNPIATMYEITQIVVQAEFGGYPVSKEDMEKINQFYLHLEQDVKKIIGFPWYLMKLIAHVLRRQKSSPAPQQ